VSVHKEKKKTKVERSTARSIARSLKNKTKTKEKMKLTVKTLQGVAFNLEAELTETVRSAFSFVESGRSCQNLA
jgi:hypothetical protein